MNLKFHMQHDQTQDFRIVKFSLVKNLRWLAVLKIAEQIKSAFSPERLCVFGRNFVWRISTAELQWLEHRWLVYNGYFELVLESIGIAADIIIFGIFRVIFFVILVMYVMCTKKNRLDTQHTFMLKKIEKLSLICHLAYAIINPHLLELPLSRTNFMIPEVFEPLKLDCSTFMLNIKMKTTCSGIRSHLPSENLRRP